MQIISYISIGFPDQFRNLVMQFPICGIQFRQICIGIEISSYKVITAQKTNIYIVFIYIPKAYSGQFTILKVIDAEIFGQR